VFQSTVVLKSACDSAGMVRDGHLSLRNDDTVKRYRQGAAFALSSTHLDLCVASSCLVLLLVQLALWRSSTQRHRLRS